MSKTQVHSFHIPVMGLAFTIDTPIRVARFGITSVISIVDDILVEHMRKHYSHVSGESYSPIGAQEVDSRARRITAYLNLVHRIVERQMEALKASAFERGSEIVKYFEMLAESSSLKSLYRKMTHTENPSIQSGLQDKLRSQIVAGKIDVNIMTKVDRSPIAKNVSPVPHASSDALSSLRGFVRSDLDSSVILSAGLNPRLFSYMGECPELLPDANGKFRKKVVLKVSDYRSSLIQGKILAKKGIWVSEFRIESGLNCGGHAFATDGDLLGPILEKFKSHRQELLDELSDLYRAALNQKGIPLPAGPMEIRVTVQGGIGTANEDTFLREYYDVDATGWGSPFLLVPEATNLDDETRAKLAHAKPEDYYLSDASPLGIPFHNFRDSSSEQNIRIRFENNKPGSPCKKKFLVSNTEFTEEPICTASSQYQRLKIDLLKGEELSAAELTNRIETVVRKACLCEDLAAAAYATSGPVEERKELPVAICPGPNLAYFSRIVSLEEMVGYIYGRTNLLTIADRSNMFVNELRLYIDYFKSQVQQRVDSLTARDEKYFATFSANLQEGIEYYRSLVSKLNRETERYKETMQKELAELEEILLNIAIPCPQLQ